MNIGTIIRKELPRLFFIILSFGLMIAVSYMFVSRIVENQLFLNVQETLNTAEATIRSDLREAEVALLQVEMLIENWLDLGISYDEIDSYVAMSAYTMKTNSIGVRGIMNIYGIIKDHQMTGLYNHPGPEYIVEDRPWYNIAQGAGGKTGLSSPYIDWVTEKIVISLAKTMHDPDGKEYGTIAMDLDFSMLTSKIESLQSTKNGYGLLCDENFRLLVHPMRSREDYMNKVITEVNPAYEKLVQELLEQHGGIVSMRMTNINKVNVMIIARQLYNGWYLGLATPVRNYYHDVNMMAIILSALGTAFMAILIITLVRLSLSKARSDEQNIGKSSFLARMSHEIRTPMNSILGMTELIQRKDISGEIREYLEIINQSGNNLLTIINDILDFSKIESGRLQIQNRDYQIASVINDMVNMMRPRVAEKSLNFLINVESEIPWQLYGDDMRLRQILTNLLSNAVKYTRRGFITMEVGTEKIDNTTLKINFTVSDTGIGIREEDQVHLFNEFARMDPKVNQGIEGTGLGLVITKALCRSMGGDITATSEYGKGSVFQGYITQEFENDEPVAQILNPENKRVLFYDWRQEYVESITKTFKDLRVDFKCVQDLKEFMKELEYGPFDFAFISSKYALDCLDIPAMRDEPLQLAIMVEPGEVSVYREVTSIQLPVYSITIANVLNNELGETMFHDNKLKLQFTAPSANILIVDDISTNLRVAKELMGPYNMNIHTCLSGAEALEMVKNNNYDIVFMDHMMPGMDGIEATALIRSLEPEDGYYQKLPIIALTANAVSGQKEIFLENGINDFLAKPIEIQKLDEILEKWLPPEKLSESEQPSRDEVKPEKFEKIDISGIDVALGLRNCGGDMTVYLDILLDFCKDAEARMVKINEAFNQGDSKLYITLVHALKGAARSIGAMETGEKAYWLEKTAANGQLAAVRGKTNDLHEHVQNLIKSVKAIVEKHEIKENPEDSEISALRLETLKTALEEMDIEAVNRILLVFTGLSLDKETKEKISEIEQLVLMFEYEKAIEKINEFFKF